MMAVMACVVAVHTVPEKVQVHYKISTVCLAACITVALQHAACITVAVHRQYCQVI
jgi:hypothetical protein